MENYLSYSVDIVGNCNLRCPSCPVGNIDLKHTRPKGFILKELFYEIADKIARESGDLNIGYHFMIGENPRYIKIYLCL